MNENQKKTTEKFRQGWDKIFSKKKVTVEEVDHGVYVIEVSTPKCKTPCGDYACDIGCVKERK
jgi:hypothetical protein